MPFIASPPTPLQKERGEPHQALYWRSGECKAIRKGNWKLCINELSEINSLYNIAEDERKEKNLYNQYPEVVKELEEDLQTWEKQMVKPLWPRVVNYVYKDKLGKQKFAF